MNRKKGLSWLTSRSMTGSDFSVTVSARRSTVGTERSHSYVTYSPKPRVKCRSMLSTAAVAQP